MMAMTPEKMADAVIKEFENVTNSIKWKDGERPSKLAYTEAFDKGLTEYVEANMEITYTWAATTPPPSSTPDPVTSFVSKIKIADKDIGQPSKAEIHGSLIMLCFEKAQTEHPAAFSAVAAGKLSITPLTITPPPGAYPGPIRAVCQQIYTWLLSCVNSAPLSGTHGSYTGATAGMVIA